MKKAVGEYERIVGASIKGNADGAEGIFGKCRMRVGCGPAIGLTLQMALC